MWTDAWISLFCVQYARRHYFWLRTAKSGEFLELFLLCMTFFRMDGKIEKLCGTALGFRGSAPTPFCRFVLLFGLRSAFWARWWAPVWFSVVPSIVKKVRISAICWDISQIRTTSQNNVAIAFNFFQRVNLISNKSTIYLFRKSFSWSTARRKTLPRI